MSRGSVIGHVDQPSLKLLNSPKSEHQQQKKDPAHPHRRRNLECPCDPPPGQYGPSRAGQALPHRGRCSGSAQLRPGTKTSDPPELRKWLRGFVCFISSPLSLLKSARALLRC